MNSKKENSRKKYVATGVAAAIVTSVAAPAAIPSVQAAENFTDVHSDAFYAKAVKELAEKGIIGGYSDGTFQPNKQVTRAEAAKILAYDLGLTSNQANSNFSDVNEKDWFFQPVTALAQSGGINGYKDGTFQPNKTITRAEMASLIVKAYGLTADSAVTAPFADVEAGSWYAEAIQTLYANKVTSGKGEVNTFAPNDPVTRGEIAVFVQRASQLKSGETPQISSDQVEGITADGIVISGVTYTVADSVKGILGEHNAAVLQGAEIDFEESDGTITKVSSLQLYAAGTSSTTEFANNLVLDGKGNSVGDLIVNANYITVKNTTVSGDLTVTNKLENDFYSEKLIVKGDTVINGGDSNTVVFKDGSLQAVELAKDGVHFEVKGSTTVGTITVSKNAKITSEKVISKIEVKENVKLNFGVDTKVNNIELPEGVDLKDVVSSSDARKNIKNVDGQSNSEYSLTAGGGGGGSSTSDSSDNDDDNDDHDSISFGATISAAGTYGPASGSTIVDGDLEITTANVILQNVVITGDLILGEGIGEGDVTLRGVTVQGQTIVNGGGSNSIHFENSVLATVIVNKNTGAVRIVAEGSTRVLEVQLETPVIIEEENLDGGADGFTNVTVPESYQSDIAVELVGTFETINSRATNVRIQLDESTDIRTLALNAAATVLGTGVIRTAEINASGSTLSTRPQNVVLDITRAGSVQVGGETITDSYSEAAEATITGIHANQYRISVDFDQFVAGLTAEDFDVTATLDGEAIELRNLEYNSAQKTFTYTPVPLTGNTGKELAITVVPTGTTTGDTIIVESPDITEGATRVVGEAQTATVVIDNGIGGRITDIQGVGVEGARLLFREGTGTTEGVVVGEAITDKYGYYSINLEPGKYTGQLVKQGYVTTYVLGVSLDDVFLPDQNETAIRAAASEEIKIMLSWGEQPYDLDSHLTGPTANQEDWFHTYFSHKVYENGETTYVDLDWDDTVSYGPETTTIRKLTDGKYVFFVHNYSGNTEDFYNEEGEFTTGDTITLRNSNAKVQVFKGNSLVADETVSVETGADNEYYWVVLSIDISNNGEDVTVTPINYLADYAGWDEYSYIPDEVQQFKNPRLAIEQKLAYIEADINPAASTLPAEKITALTAAVSEAETVLANVNATQAQLYAKLIQLLTALEPFKDVAVVDDIFASIKAELATIPEDLSTITSDNYEEYYQLMDTISGLIAEAYNSGITEEELSSKVDLNKFHLFEVRVFLMIAAERLSDRILGYNESADRITEDLDLPPDGADGSTITWTSSNEDIISTTGKVTRPEEGSADGNVLLTARLTNGDQSITKEYKFTVLAEGSEGTEVPEGTTPDDGEEDNVLVTILEADGTEGVLTTGDTIQFTFDTLPEAIATTADSIQIQIIDFETTTSDAIAIKLDGQIFARLTATNADYVSNGEVIFSSTISVVDNKVAFRLEEIISGEENLNQDHQEDPNFVVEYVAD